MLQSVHFSYAVLADRENVGVAFGIVLLSCLEAEIIIIITIIIINLYNAINP